MTANSGHSIRVTLAHTRGAAASSCSEAEASATVAAALRGRGHRVHRRADRPPSRRHRGAVTASVRLTLRRPDRGAPLGAGPARPRDTDAGLFGLIGVDIYGRVKGLTDVYAAGDATDYPVKQGDIACQQADAVATAIAARHAGAAPASPFQPVLRATLLTGTGAPITLGPGAGADELGKLPGRYLRHTCARSWSPL